MSKSTPQTLRCFWEVQEVNPFGEIQILTTMWRDPSSRRDSRFTKYIDRKIYYGGLYPRWLNYFSVWPLRGSHFVCLFVWTQDCKTSFVHIYWLVPLPWKEFLGVSVFHEEKSPCILSMRPLKCLWKSEWLDQCKTWDHPSGLKV